MGLSKESSVYQGSGHVHFLIRNLSVESQDVSISNDDKLVLVDVGAREGLDFAWTPLIDQLQMVMFEPDEVEAERIRLTLPPNAGHIVMATALHNDDLESKFNVCRAIGCSSILEPNRETLDKYEKCRDWFDVIKESTVKCTTYAKLFEQKQVPAPDVIKIDVQGLEYQVLEGFGELLDYVIAVELEAHFYPMYKGQKLIGDIVSFLDKRDLALRKLQNQGYERFNNEILEVNAFFSKRNINLNQRKKMFLTFKAWDETKPR
jgi:FkbM family methyltransferase